MSEIKIIGQMDNTQDHTFESANRVYRTDGIAPTIPTSCGGGHTPKFMEIQELGYIEKGTGKHQSNVVYDNEGIAPTVCAMYGVKQPLAMFAEVKALDEQNMQVRDGTIGTLTTDGSSPKHNNRIMEIQKVGNVVGKGESQGGNTYLTNGISPSLLAGMSHGNVMPFIVDEKPLNTMEDGTCRTIKSQYHQTSTQNLDSQGTFGATGAVSIVAMRGRKEGQQLEPRPDECTNTITTVQKDNLVMVRQATKDGYIPCEVGGGSRFELSEQPNTKRKGNRSRECESYSDNGEYP